MSGLGNLAGVVHAAPKHAVPAPHTVSQAPQWSLSTAVSTHASPQRVSSAPQGEPPAPPEPPPPCAPVVDEVLPAPISPGTGPHAARPNDAEATQRMERIPRRSGSERTRMKASS